MRVEIVSYLAQALALSQKHNQPVDGGRERCPGPGALSEQRHDLRVPREELEL